MITVAIGDIHGMYVMLDRLLGEIDAFALQERWAERPRLIFLGDYVDRGPDARQVVRRVRTLQGAFAICLRGNHEDLMARCRDRPIDWQNFLMNGGSQTLASYAMRQEIKSAFFAFQVGEGKVVTEVTDHPRNAEFMLKRP